MRLRRRLNRLKWCGALGVAVVLHAAVFWGLLPQAFPPPLAQPASTRVLLISLPPSEPHVIEEMGVSEFPPQLVDSSTPLVAEASPVEVKVNASEREREFVPDRPPERERGPVKPELERALTSEQKQEPEPEVERAVIDEPVFAEPSAPFSDPVVAVKDRVDVDGLFDVPPRALQTIEPNYPLAARRKKREGDVLCEAVITKRGRVEIASVVSSSGYQKLDDAALVALRCARFEPATRRGRSVKATIRITIVFRLTGR